MDQEIAAANYRMLQAQKLIDQLEKLIEEDGGSRVEEPGSRSRRKDLKRK